MSNCSNPFSNEAHINSRKFPVCMTIDVVINYFLRLGAVAFLCSFISRLTHNKTISPDAVLILTKTKHSL